MVGIILGFLLMLVALAMLVIMGILWIGTFRAENSADACDRTGEAYFSSIILGIIMALSILASLDLWANNNFLVAIKDTGEFIWIGF